MSLKARDLRILRARLKGSDGQEWLLDLWTHPSTGISYKPCNVQYPNPQHMIVSMAEGALRIHLSMAVGNLQENWVFFHGNRLCQVLMTANCSCLPIIDDILDDLEPGR